MRTRLLSRRGPGTGGVVRLAVAAVALSGLAGTSLAAQPAAAAETVTYTASQTIPVPPASSYAGSAGGDGWNVAVGPTQVFNVFHHAGNLTIACHQQSDASECWSPRTIRDADGHDFATSGHSGVWFDPTDNNAYVYATRASDASAGVVCIDTVQAKTVENPFCGYTALAPAGSAPISSGISVLSEPVKAGGRWYAFNYVSGQASAGAENALLCFDLTSHQACPGQPRPVGLGAGTFSVGDYPEPQVAVVGDRIVVAGTLDGESRLGCFDVAAAAVCSGSWPLTLDFEYTSNFGAPFPMLDAAGRPTGFCLPTGADPCFTLEGAAAATPAALPAAVPGTIGWNGTAVTVGSRVFVPNGYGNSVSCFSWASETACPSFPKTFSDLNLLYTVNPDPGRPTCLWVNADNGTQIHSFDAYTGGACGTGAIRVLASQFVVPTDTCRPATYTSLAITKPMRAEYDSGSVAFQNSDAQPIPNVDDAPIDADGSVVLTGKNLSTDVGLPQFLVGLDNLAHPIGEVGVTLTWTGVNDPSCVNPGTVVTPGEPGHPACADAVFLAVPGNGETFRSSSNLRVTRELRNLYRAMASKATTKQISYQVIDNPVPAIDRMTAGLSRVRAADPAAFTTAQKAKLASNLARYVTGHEHGLADLRAAFTQVRADCGPQTKIVLGGYSQGALVVHEFLAELGAGDDASAKAAVAAVALIADPARVKQSAVPETATAAAAGSGGCALLSDLYPCAGSAEIHDVPAAFAPRAVSVCLSGDPACDTSTMLDSLVANWSRTNERATIAGQANKIHASYAASPVVVSTGESIGTRLNGL
jgi:Cutinase